jgi:hypothetical protein
LIVHQPIEMPVNAEPSVQQVRELADRIREVIRPAVEAEAARG